jgi:REP element-mobilizing transposase RayT
MGKGHQQFKQQKFAFENVKSAHRFCHGGILRKKRAGRGQRPLSTKESLHLIFKANKEKLRHRSLRSSSNFALIHQIVRIYSRRFFVKIEQISIQNDHIHLLIRTGRRSFFHFFFRVVAGQIAQRMEKEGLLITAVTGTPRNDEKTTNKSKNSGLQRKAGTNLWKYRPFTRVVRSWTAFKDVRIYIQLNEKEAQGQIKYRKERLRGLSSGEWEILWG